MKQEREIDKTISVLILVAFAVMWAIYWIIAYVPNVPAGVVKGVAITRDVVQCLMYLVVLYNALGSTSNIILKIVYIAIALFLIFCVIAGYVPAFANLLKPYNIPVLT